MKPLKGASLYGHQLQKSCLLSSGSEEIDSALDGGLMSGEITELIGPSCSGKTQFCLTFAVSVVSQTKDGHVLYVDLCNTLCPQRLIEILENNKGISKKSEVQGCLDKIHCWAAFDVFQLVDFIQRLIMTNTCQTLNVKAVILDGCALVLSQTITGKQKSGIHYLMKVSRLLKQLVAKSNVAVLITNNLVGNAVLGLKPALGQWWSTTANIRILINKSKTATETKLQMSVIKGSRMTPGETFPIRLCEKGIKGDSEPNCKWNYDDSIDSSEESSTDEIMNDLLVGN